METATDTQQLLVPIAYVVAILGTLTSAIAALFWQLQKQNSTWREESNLNTLKMTQVVSENNHAMEMLTNAVNNNTKSTDRIFEHLTKPK